jgi:hypothetical protein
MPPSHFSSPLTSLSPSPPPDLPPPPPPSCAPSQVYPSPSSTPLPLIDCLPTYPLTYPDVALSLVLFFIAAPVRAAAILRDPHKQLDAYISELKSDGDWPFGEEETETELAAILEDDTFLPLLARLCPCFEALHRAGRIDKLEWEVARWGNHDFPGQRKVMECQERNWKFAVEVESGIWRNELITLFSSERIGGKHLSWPEKYVAD